MNLKPLPQLGLVADKPAKPAPQRISQRIGEGRKQYPRVRIGASNR
jgi:hypothetical protein